MIMLFSSNIRRKTKKTQGNYVFRKRRTKAGALTRLEVRHRHYMDLNPETEATRRQKRLRTAGIGVKVAAILLFVMGLFSAGVIVVKRAFVENQRFLLKHISVVTDGSAGLTAGELIQASGLKEGMNLLSVSLVKVREKVEMLPQVRQCKVTRGYPGIVFIEVTQRTPVAWLESPQMNLAANVPGRGCLLDSEGVVVPSLEVTEAHRALPVIKVKKVDRLVPGQKVAHPDVLAGLEFVKQHLNHPVSNLLSLHKVDVSRGYPLRATYDNNLRVVYPRLDYAYQMQRLVRIVELAEEKQWDVARVNLLVEMNVPVTFKDGNEDDADEDLDPLERPAKKREALARSF